MYVNENGQLTNIHSDHVNPTQAQQLLHKFNLDWNVEKFPLKFETKFDYNNQKFAQHDSGFLDSILDNDS